MLVDNMAAKIFNNGLLVSTLFAALFGGFTNSNVTRNFHYSCVTEITCLLGTAIGQGHQNSTKNRWGRLWGGAYC